MQKRRLLGTGLATAVFFAAGFVALFALTNEAGKVSETANEKIRKGENQPTGEQLYVSTQGNDRWTGREPAPDKSQTDGPLATVARAMDAVRNRPICRGSYDSCGTTAC